MSALDRTVTGTLAALAPGLDRAAEQLPQPVSITVNHRGVSIMVWLAGAPLQALLAWAEQLTDVEFYASRHDATETTQVSVFGLLDDAIRVELVAYTSHVVGPGGAAIAPVTEWDIRGVAQTETALSDSGVIG